MKIQKSGKGEWISTLGGVFVVIGIMCMVFEANNYLIFGFLILGIVITGYGIVRSMTEKKFDIKNEDKDLK